MARPVRRLLIANRGEIAVRIARTAHRMGIDTVGVYSDPDAVSVHVDAVDVAFALGGSSPRESYLRGDALIAAALETGCDAVHPGYGFLAENAAFASAVAAAGLIWVGPTADQIALLGDKIIAKQTALEAGVATTPVIEVGPGGVSRDVPMPALVKSTAGGGGRGMRIVRTAAELEGAIAAAAREAESAFGDGRVFIEPYLESGRHVEVQVIGDHHGTVLHLGERECSIQRRNQKIIEEAPAPGIDDATRRLLWDGAVALARHVGYRNAGTVEFLVGEDGTISFLEVNTRLQVEHPVTEAVTGLDIVELQLRVAGGDVLGLTQDDVSFSGHAIEARIVAEDPAAGWLPSTGAVIGFDIDGDVRVDAGVRRGSLVSPDYDSLLAKVIGHAPSRGEAAAKLRRALRTAEIVGPKTNVAALAATLGEADFLAGHTPTSYLVHHPEVEQASGPAGEHRIALLLAAVLATELANRQRNSVTGFAPAGWRNLRTQGQRQVWLLDDEPHAVEYVMRGDGAAEVKLGPFPAPDDTGALPDDGRRVLQVRAFARRADRQVLEVDGLRTVVRISRDGSRVLTRSAAGSLAWTLAPRFEAHRADEAAGGPVCPLPGTVIAVHVEAGQTVAEGQLLMVVEAMKMEHKIMAGSDATVAEVVFSVGDRVDTGDLLVRLEAR
jgi:propionyl-CoA carboxylase alpha chain